MPIMGGRGVRTASLTGRAQHGAGVSVRVFWWWYGPS